jgi:hypothetical protein
LQYDAVNRKWLYWNDFTLTGLTAWRDQTREQLDRTSSSDDDTVEDALVAEDDDTITTEDAPPDLPDGQALMGPIPPKNTVPDAQTTNLVQGPAPPQLSTNGPTAEAAIRSPRRFGLSSISSAPPLLSRGLGIPVA